MEAATEPQYDVIAKLSPHGEPLLGDAQVILGDGTTKIEFKRGRARVNAEQAEMIRHRGDVDVLGYTPELVPREVTEAAPIKAAPLPPGAVVNGDGTITLPASALSDEQREAVRQALDIAPVEHETVKPTPGDEAALAAAKEYLADEGMAEDLPPVEKVVTVPEGFSMTTTEGEKRCLARKGDGSQCSNAAKGDTTACGLKQHQAQLQID